MKTSTAAIAVLLVAVLCYQASSSPQSVNFSSPCCIKYSQRAFPLSRIKKFERTGSHCSQPAVIFISFLDNMVCGNPHDQWVKDIVNHPKWMADNALHRPGSTSARTSSHGHL
ncbi:PREDICTED: C-C motif chemokine 5-like [Mesitornis unicolor]|uniref:C-C motif chemokine 5-like n=1 Tax=Mesitornis unicolor TaxID=54374 RepID=UPI0005285421|nr:PREDICTED: C-C motif chemokine 5-like [Mesitornis unicolor]